MVEGFPGMYKVLGFNSQMSMTGVETATCNPSTEEVEAGGAKVQIILCCIGNWGWSGIEILSQTRKEERKQGRKKER